MSPGSSLRDEDYASSRSEEMKSRLEELYESDASTGLQRRELGITWKSLTVNVIGTDAAIHDNFVTQFDVLRKIRQSRKTLVPRSILHDSHGCVKPGEMLLVLGRPGSGCTTLLSVLANKRRGYQSVTGDVHYGSMNYEEARMNNAQIVMNTEDELFFPSLTVRQTMDFATRLKVPFEVPRGINNKDEFSQRTRDFLLQSLGIEHTKDTQVGNEYVRGVSGGERKRVSIAECLATRASIYCWDNSTRGLDASTALEYIRTIRAFTDILGLSTIVTLYQTSNKIYELFDKVLVLDQGQQIFYGPKSQARPFMESLGFVCPEGANVADFLTGVTVPTERKILPGHEMKVPRTAKELRVLYEELFPAKADEFNYPMSNDAREKTVVFQQAIAREKDSRLSNASPFTVGIVAQIKTCIIRQYQIIWGDKRTFLTRQASTIVLALIAGSLFYAAPDNSAGLFVKSGALFFATLFNAMVSISEVANSFSGRPVLLKHKHLGLHHPSAVCIAQIAADIPLIIFQVTFFSLILYFLVSLKQTASAFLTYWIILYATALTTTALFRAIGAVCSTFDQASKWAGIVIGAVNLYSGYMLNYHEMHPWFVWIFWIDPLAYAFDGLLSNELHGTVVDCVGENLIPSGPGYENSSHQACAGVGGSEPYQTFVTGDAYLESMTYNESHVWRNFGILWAMWLFLAVITIIFTARWRSSSEGGTSLLIPREKQKLSQSFAVDVETCSENACGISRVEKQDDDDGLTGKVVRNMSILTWNNLSYTVCTSSGDRLLLNQVKGWVRPGRLGALMGISGAGKTTLLDILAQRKSGNEGTLQGSILVDGQSLPLSYQRCVGYCEQLDIHEPFTTVREALEFSARLRQDRDTPDEDKMRYVQTIINLLELNELANTLIGRSDAGLTVEQRKRVTIGVELVAKPSILLFLDEPTSGLDGQAAYNTVRFLRKLADLGQAVLVTIHQPSAQVFAQFDTLLLLAKGGKLAYFGDIGQGAETIKDYFRKNGSPCPPGLNPAEHIIDVVSSAHSQAKDWADLWRSSPEARDVDQELQRMESETAASLQNPSPTTMQHRGEFATSLWGQIRLVTSRNSLSLFRNTDYVNNKLTLHIGAALFNSLTFLMIGPAISGLQSRIFTIFNYAFVAPGALNQLQPLFLERRNIFEMREAKSKMYSWFAFTVAVILSEIPYLFLCATLYFVGWYWIVGFPSDADRSGPTFLIMLIYQFVYTAIGQTVAVYAPNATFASFVSPVLIAILVPFCGVLVPYDQIQAFWRYWLYYLNPFTFLTRSMLAFDVWGTRVACTESEFAIFDPPPGESCGEYLEPYLLGAGSGSHLENPSDMIGCRVCQYRDGSDYLRTLNITSYSDRWRDVGILAAFAVSSYALVFLLMKLKNGRAKKV